MYFFKKKTVAICFILATSAIILGAFFYSKASPAMAQIKQNGLPCVMYHHVLGNNSKLLGDYVVSQAEFESDLAWLLANGYTAVSASEIIACVNGGKSLPKKPVFLTFDDGYESFYANALPLLEKYNAKALISVIGRYSELYSQADISKHLNYSHINWQQMRELNENPLVEIGCHSYDMHDATGKKSHSGAKKSQHESDEKYKEFFMQDTQKLQDALQKNIGTKALVYAYPFGYYSDISEQVLKQMGFEMTLGCEEGFTQISSDPSCLYLIKRYNRPHGESSESFFHKMGMENG